MPSYLYLSPVCHKNTFLAVLDKLGSQTDIWSQILCPTHACSSQRERLINPILSTLLIDYSVAILMHLFSTLHVLQGHTRQNQQDLTLFSGQNVMLA